MSQRIFIVLLIAVIAVGCDLNTYTPTAENLRSKRNPSGAFIVGESGIQGVWANMDVDSSIYTYTTSCESAPEFWAAVAATASDAGWSTIDDKTLGENCKRFLCITPKTGEQMFHGVEEARVAFRTQDHRVVVAWVQADQQNLPKTFPDDGPEGDFARRVVWPKFSHTVASKPES